MMVIMVTTMMELIMHIFGMEDQFIMENKKVNIYEFKDHFYNSANTYINISDLSCKYALDLHCDNLKFRNFFKNDNYILLPSIMRDYKEIKREFVEKNTTVEQYNEFLINSQGDFYEEFDEFLRQTDLEEQWFEFEEGKAVNYAVKFCDENNIEYYFKDGKSI
jgi:hypothetical protein